MWVYVVMQFSRTKLGTMERSKFQRKLKNDGFRTMSNCLFVKYCQNLDDSIKHRKRVEKSVYRYSNVSVIFVGDKQNEYSYHHVSHGKCNEIQLNPLENIEFF